MKNPKNDLYLLLCLRVSAFLCFAGWTWVHYYWEAPYGALVWDDSTYALAESLGFSWDEFVGTGADDGLVQLFLGKSAVFNLDLRFRLPRC